MEKEKIISIIRQIWEKALPKIEPDDLKKLKEMDERELVIWLEADLSGALKKCDSEEIQYFKELVGDLVDFDKCLKEANIRKDFDCALRSVKKGSELSWLIGYRFSSDDLMQLMKLHKSNKHRKKIEDLLEDCNFHPECGFLRSRDYEGYKNCVTS